MHFCLCDVLPLISVLKLTCPEVTMAPQKRIRICCLSCRGKMGLCVCVFVYSQQLRGQLHFSWINGHVSRTQQACRPQDGPCVRTEKWVLWKPAYSPSVASPPEARIHVHYRKNNTRSKNYHESLSKWN